MRRLIPALLVVGGILLVPYLIGRLNNALADGSESPFGPDESTYAVADERRGEAGDGDRGERRRPRHHHGPHDGHDRDRHPHHERHGHRGPPGPPPGHHHAMRRLDDIIDRLAKIEAKLGIEDPAPARRERRPEGRGEGRPEAGPDRAERQGPPEEMRRAWEERVEEGRRRMEDARRRFRDMEERVQKLEAEIERLKAGKTGS